MKLPAMLQLLLSTLMYNFGPILDNMYKFWALPLLQPNMVSNYFNFLFMWLLGKNLTY